MFFSRKYLNFLVLVLAGEMVFSLPFHIPRFFRSTFLIELDLTNTQLGGLFAIYGLTAMISYFPGGWLADQFRAKYLISFSLLTTSLGSVILLGLHSYMSLCILYAYWGITTILLFWGALIKTARNWGGSHFQGLTFGILDGGRGLIAAIFASGAYFTFSFLLKHSFFFSALDSVIIYYSFMTFMVAIFSWFCLSDNAEDKVGKYRTEKNVFNFVTNRKIIFQAIIVFCSYTAYKSIDNFALYFYDVLKMSEKESAKIMTLLAYLRPFSAIIAGVIADRFSTGKTIVFLFLILLFSYGSLSHILYEEKVIFIIFVNIIITLVSVYSLRGIYFALLEQTKTPKNVTGLAVGVISLVGFMPDIFYGPIAGVLLDSNRNIIGHQDCFNLLFIVSLIGMLFSLLLVKTLKR